MDALQKIEFIREMCIEGEMINAYITIIDVELFCSSLTELIQNGNFKIRYVSTMLVDEIYESLI